MMRIFWFLTAFDTYILPALFACVWIFGGANWLFNIYGRQNRQLLRCRVNIQRKPSLAVLYLSNVPAEYRRQWRAYINSGAARPSLVFEFVPRKNKIIGVHFISLCAILSTAYLALFVFGIAPKREYVVFQAAFWVSFALAMVLNRLAYLHKEKCARREFAKFVVQLNALGKPTPAPQTQTVTEQLCQMRKAPVVDTTLEKAAALLRQIGLDNTRSVEEQRKLNRALNSLLQAYSRNAQHGLA